MGSLESKLQVECGPVCETRSPTRSPPHSPHSPHRRAATPLPDSSLAASASPAATSPLHRRRLNPLLDLVFSVRRKGPTLSGEAPGTMVAARPEMPKSGGGSAIRRWWLSGVWCGFGFGGVVPDWGCVRGGQLRGVSGFDGLVVRCGVAPRPLPWRTRDSWFEMKGIDAGGMMVDDVLGCR
ncbi:hypothetical protein Droror1_Dr00006245 [Drosera rotundifolia]